MDLWGAVFFLAQTIRKCMLRSDCVLNEGCFLFQGFWFEIWRVLFWLDMATGLKIKQRGSLGLIESDRDGANMLTQNDGLLETIPHVCPVFFCCLCCPSMLRKPWVMMKGYIYIYIWDATACLAFNFAGEFDNECVAMAAFCTAFWLWCRSIRHSSSWPWAVPAALAYVPWRCQLRWTGEGSYCGSWCSSS